MTALHSAVVSSRGSRRPELDRQCDAREVARVGQLPRQADRRVEARLEVVDEPAGGGDAHVALRSAIMPVSASVASARAYAGSSASVTPAARHASRPVGCSASAATTASSCGS